MAYSIEKALRKTLEERGIRQKFICERVGISASSFNLSMNCKRELKANELISICLYLGIDLNTFKN